MTWIVLVNSSLCRIYFFDRREHKITPIKEIAHPENRNKASDYFTSDKPGHYQSSSTAHGSYEPHTDPKETGIQRFAIEVANELDHARTQNAYKRIVLISPPHMLGLLHEHMNKHVKQLITNEINKDILHLSDHELLSFLKDQ